MIAIHDSNGLGRCSSITCGFLIFYGSQSIIKNDNEEIKYFDNRPGGENLNDEQKSKEIQYEENLRDLDIYCNKVFNYFYQKRCKNAEKTPLNKGNFIILYCANLDYLDTKDNDYTF